MSIFRYSRKSVTEGFSEAPVLFPGFPGAMSGTRAAKLWGKSCKMVNHAPAPPKSTCMLGRHRNQGEMGQRSPPCDSWDSATMGEIPPTCGVPATLACHSSPKTHVPAPNTVTGQAMMPRQEVKSREGLARRKGGN